MRTHLARAIPACLLLATGVASAQTELIQNGGFETGDFTAWTVIDVDSGNFLVLDTDILPLSGFPTVGAAGGTFYAVTDQTGPGVHLLIQPFTVAAGTGSLTLSFDMFVNDWSDVGPIDCGVLDSGGDPCQIARVDVLTGAADPFSTAPGDIVSQIYLGVDPLADPNPYTAYNVDLSALPAGDYQLSFASVDNQYFQNQGVDNVRLLAEAGGPDAMLSADYMGATGTAGICINQSTGDRVTVPLFGGTNVDCVGAGLTVTPGDSVLVIFLGTVVPPAQPENRIHIDSGNGGKRY